jgi:hypothetical protein
MAHLRFRQLRMPPLLRVHVSDYGLCSLVDVHMLYPDVLVTAVTKAAISLELHRVRPQ